MRQQRKNQKRKKKIPLLEDVTSHTVTTDDAAYYLNRKPQTLRVWACLENGALRPIRINGRLAWQVAEIKKVLGMAEED